MSVKDGSGVDQTGEVAPAAVLGDESISHNGE